jgi:hypothetical protein
MRQQILEEALREIKLIASFPNPNLIDPREALESIWDICNSASRVQSTRIITTPAAMVAPYGETPEASTPHPVVGVVFCTFAGARYSANEN